MGKRRSLHCTQSCSAIRGKQYDVAVLCKRDVRVLRVVVLYCIIIPCRQVEGETPNCADGASGDGMGWDSESEPDQRSHDGQHRR